MIKAMIVEDEETLHVLYIMMLDLMHIQIVGTAKNGAEAVERYKSLKEKPEIILMDYRMPIKNGIEATKDLKAIDSNSKILFASADSAIEHEAMSVGAIGFLLKPFGFEDLKKAINKALNLA